MMLSLEKDSIERSRTEQNRSSHKTLDLTSGFEVERCEGEKTWGGGPASRRWRGQPSYGSQLEMSTVTAMNLERRSVWPALVCYHRPYIMKLPWFCEGAMACANRPFDQPVQLRGVVLSLLLRCPARDTVESFTFELRSVVELDAAVSTRMLWLVANHEGHEMHTQSSTQKHILHPLPNGKL